MRTTRAALATIVVLLPACASARLGDPTAEPSRTTTATTESPIPTATETVPEVSVAPTPQATASTQATTSPQPTESPFGAAVFADPDDCVNSVSGYRVAYPDDWYSNAGIANPLNPAAEGIAPCQYFAPTTFEVVYGTEPSPAIAISIAVIELPEGVTWNYGPFEGYAILSSAPATIDGYPARVQEVEVTEPSIGFWSLGDRYTEYVVDLGANRYLTAQTRNPNVYDMSREILDDMMRTLELVS
jgi:hypothetical protein